VPGLPSLAPLLARVRPAVVSIAVSGRVVEQSPLFQDPAFRRFFGLPDAPLEREFHSAGSGVIVDAKEGHVVTNHHVIRNADQITVVLSDGRSLDAKVVGADPAADVAVIQVRPENLTAIPLGDSGALQVGDFVVAVGNPFGLSQTATLGIVSALGRTGLGIEGYEDFIQTDAAINPGNSGGALANLSGELVGINTAIVGPAGGNVGVGFAIPIRMASDIVEQLIEHGEVRRGQLGVLVQDLTPDLARFFQVEGTGGAVVSQVVPGSAAERAGLRRGDVVLSIDAEPVKSAAELRNRIGLRRVGDEAKLEILRQGERESVEVEIRAPAREPSP
jgi:serine protease Do/serine protease DegQ